LLVTGDVDSDEALDHLKKLVHDSHPPAEVIYHVHVITPETRRKMEEFRAKEDNAVRHE
jgi:hypothetical protein